MRVPRFSQQGPSNGRVQGAGGVAPVQPAGPGQLQQVGQGLQQFGEGLQRLGEQRMLDHDVAEAKRASNLFDEFTRNHLSPKTGYRSKLGKEAADGYDDALKALEEKRREFGATLQEGRQRDRFEEMAQAKAAMARGQIDAHAARQIQAHNIAETSAMADGLMSEWADSVGDPTAEQVVMGRLKRTLGELGDLTGAGPEQRAQIEREAMTQLHSQAFASLIESGRTEDARGYLEDYQGDIAPKVRASLQGALRKQETNDKAQALAVEHDGKTLAQIEALADKWHAEKRISVEVRDEWMNRALRRKALDERQRTQASNDALLEAQQHVQLGGELTPSMVAKLEASGAMSAYRLWERQGGQWITTEAGFRALMTLEPQDLLQFDSDEQVYDMFRPMLDDRGMQQMIGMWRDGRQLAGLGGTSGRVSQQHKPIGYDESRMLRMGFRGIPQIGDDDQRKARKDLFDAAVYRAYRGMLSDGEKWNEEKFSKAIAQVKLNMAMVGSEQIPLETVLPEEYESATVDTGRADPLRPDDGTAFPLNLLTPEVRDRAATGASNLMDVVTQAQQNRIADNAANTAKRTEAIKQLVKWQGFVFRGTGQAARDREANERMRELGLEPNREVATSRSMHEASREQVLDRFRYIWLDAGMTREQAAQALDEAAGVDKPDPSKPKPDPTAGNPLLFF